MREHPRQVVDVDQEPAAVTEDSTDSAEHPGVRRLVEVAERREPEDGRVEARLVPRQRAHVAVHVVDAGTALTRLRQEELVRVETGELRTARGEPVRDPPVAAREIE